MNTEQNVDFYERCTEALKESYFFSISSADEDTRGMKSATNGMFVGEMLQR